jgi:hypothetical protein
MRKYIFYLISVLFAASSISATVIHIPIDYPTIQQGIDASYDGDTVLVKPGEYVENVEIRQHNIVLASYYLTTGDTSYISTTIINGDSIDVVITLIENDSSVTVCGFTIKNGRSIVVIGGGGIRCAFSSNVIISNNIVEDNFNLETNQITGGGGICGYNSAGIIRNNVIRNNDGGEWGGGIFCRMSDFIIMNNIILSNVACWGGGIGLYESNAFVHNNVIYENIADI